MNGCYTGKKIDRDTGLYYFNARWYDPQLGRFITEDPIKDGTNWFAYANNNPLRYIDPTGLLTEDGVVEEGDTLSEIAEVVLDRTGLDLSPEHLAETNDIEDPDLIYPGDKIDTIVPEIVKSTTPLESKDPDLVKLEDLEKINSIISSDNPGSQLVGGLIQMGTAEVAGPGGLLLAYDGLLKSTGMLAEMIAATSQGRPVKATPDLVGMESVFGPVVGAFTGDKGRAQELTDKAAQYYRGASAAIEGDIIGSGEMFK